MPSLEEFRESYINEDVNAEALVSSRYPIEVFIESAADILQHDYSLINGMEQCYYQYTRGAKSMRVDAAYLDLPMSTLNLLLADYNPDSVKSITNTFISQKSKLLVNYLENALKDHFKDAEQADPAVQIARDIKQNFSNIGKIQLFIISTDRLSEAVKDLSQPDFKYGGRSIPVELTVLDIEKIYHSKLPGFQKEDLVIKCEDFGIEGIPCIKAEIETDQYDSYLAIVPGKFLSDIYKKYNSALLESNVRSFLKFNGGVNKGIRGTVLNEKERFFTYNNGISTTASEIELSEESKGGKIITSFKNLQIINGGQTTATLAATSIKNNADLNGIYVQMKLTVLKNADPDLVRCIATYANSQNKVKTADLNSSHPFYVRMEEFSRNTYAPATTGQIVQQLWYFERARGQYEQPLMQMTKKQCEIYKITNPKSKRFTLSDLAKYENCAQMLPHYVSWGGEVNAAHFHNNMVKQWDKNKDVYGVLYYKELIGAKILYEHIGNVISDQEWYQERRAYRPQLIAYTFSKLAYEAKQIKTSINYRKIWDLQEVPEYIDKDIATIAKQVFDVLYDDSRPTANIETYCKREECWKTVSKCKYELAVESYQLLISTEDRQIENARDLREVRFDSGIENEIGIFNKGKPYWESLKTRGTQQNVLNAADCKALSDAVKYCDFIYTELRPQQVSAITAVVEKLKSNGIE